VNICDTCWHGLSADKLNDENKLDIAENTSFDVIAEERMIFNLFEVKKECMFTYP
jgi:hypothetical protein